MRFTLSALTALFISIAPAFATTIAFDGKYLCGDRALSGGDGMRQLCKTKIFYNPKRKQYLGVAGTWSDCQKVIYWFMSTDKGFLCALKGEFHAILIDPKIGVVMYEGDLSAPYEIEAPCSIGSGCQVAKTAMNLGKNAIEAVQLAGKTLNNTSEEVTFYDTSIDPMAPAKVATK